jgi:hypothetical protein
MTRIDVDGLVWRTSSHTADGNQCVEVAVLPDRRVAIRDSKHPDEAILIYTPDEWRAFIAGARAGEFDLA